MPRSALNKNDMLYRVYKLKTGLYDGTMWGDASEEHKKGVHDALGRVLEILNEYSS